MNSALDNNSIYNYKSASCVQTDALECVAHLKAENAALRDALSASQGTVATLTARVAELERQLGLNSSNSSKPPSTDGLKKPTKKPKTTSLRVPSGKKPGGQPGHKGETLQQVDNPDVIVNHYPEICQGCGAPLTQDTAKTYSVRQVVDLPQPQPLVVTEHRAHTCQCEECGETTKAAFPEQVKAPVQYGERMIGFIVYLLQYQYIPEYRLVELMLDLFGVKIATATIARMSANTAGRFQGFVYMLCEIVKAAMVKHLDETGFRIGGKLQWLHVMATEWISYYRVSPKRGSLLEGIIGIIIHDHWRPYYTLKGVLHALCNAHHLRELKAIIDNGNKRWAIRMQRLLRRACHVVNLARELCKTLPPSLVALIQRQYDAIIAEGLAFYESLPPLPIKGLRGRNPRRPGHNLLIRLSERRDDVLRFLTDPRVPFTNNLAEQAVRMIKLRQKNLRRIPFRSRRK